MSVKLATAKEIATPSFRNRVSPEEWKTRVDVAACYHLIDLYGMTDMIANHVSARIPGEQEHFLINAYGFLYSEITASNLIKIDIHGNVLMKPDLEYSFNHAGFVIHGAIHAARHDVQCVIHTHTPAGQAVASLECGLLPMTPSAMRFSKVAYHDFVGISVNLEEQKSLVEDLGDADAMLLRNHGLIVVGGSVPEAFNSIYRLELACKAQIAAMSCHSNIVLPPKPVVEFTHSQFQPSVLRRMGILEWPAMLRQLEKAGRVYDI